MQNSCVIFGGTAHPALAAAIVRELDMPSGVLQVERFPDGEVGVSLQESVRKREVFIVQPTAPPVDTHLIELLAIADACRRDAAAHITAVVPYFGYARGDARHGRREPVMARTVADLIQTVGVDQVLTVDLHTPQIEGFFQIPVDSLRATPVLCDALRQHLPADLVVVSPDAGRVKMAAEYAQRLGASVAVLHKQRDSGDETRVLRIIGEVRDRPCLLIDDMIATGGTIATSVEALVAAGARPGITVAATHGLLVGDACERLAAAGVREIFVTDTVPPVQTDRLEIHVVSAAPLIASALRQIIAGGTLDDLG